MFLQTIEFYLKCSYILGADRHRLVAYWGQNAVYNMKKERQYWEKDLVHFCQNSKYDVVVLAFMHVFFDKRQKGLVFSIISSGGSWIPRSAGILLLLIHSQICLIYEATKILLSSPKIAQCIICQFSMTKPKYTYTLKSNQNTKFFCSFLYCPRTESRYIDNSLCSV